MAEEDYVATLLEAIRENGGTITLTQMRRRRGRWRDKNAAEAALMALARAGYGEVGMSPAGPKGGGQSFRFRLFPQRRQMPEKQAARAAGGSAAGGGSGEIARVVVPPARKAVRKVGFLYRLFRFLGRAL